MKSVEEIRKLMIQGIIHASQQKLTRDLTKEEISGIENIHSLMMLEAVDMSACSEKTTPEQLEKDLAHFASEIGQ